ncbi:MAG: asparagine--tRNA ligase [Gemmatimonadales bacterium]|nr:asparagine--tRNA ligase [Gemmatimonadales bacterium]
MSATEAARTTSARIRALRERVGQSVRVQGWVVTLRTSGKLAFLVLRDGTGTLQCVVGKRDVAEATWATVAGLVLEASVTVTGTVREDARSPGGVELQLAECELVGQSPEYPIQPKEHSTQFLFEHRHLWLRSRRQVAIAKVRHQVSMAIRDFFDRDGFTLVDTPILTGAIGEQAGELFATDYFDLGKAYLAQTGQLYVEAAAAALGKVYCFGPTFRAEKSKTRRHLTEFWMCEPEVAFHDSNDNMRLQERLVSYIVERALERAGEELKELERDTAPLARVTAPFPRISYTDAVAKLHTLGSDMQWGQDLGGDDETLLAKEYDRPVLVYNYPKGVKAFYMKENPDDPRTVLNNDCLAPEGYGEIIGGSQREDDHDRLLARIVEQGLDPASYGWYLDLRKYGTFVHSGFGLGLERTVAWICGIPHIREAIAFPRQIHRLHP